MAIHRIKSATPFVYSEGLQVLRGLAALMIVFLHLSVAESRYGLIPGFKFLENFHLGAAGVDIFFVISGFVMILVTRNKQTSPRSFFANRLTRIYPNYWVYFLIVSVVWLIQPTWVNSSLPGTPGFIPAFLLLPSSGIPVVSVAWTLEFELYFYLVFAILLGFFKERLSLALFIFMACLVLIGTWCSSTNILLERITHPLILEFAAGAVIGQMLLSRKTSGSWLYLPIAIILFIAYQMGFAITDFVSGSDRFERVINFGIPAAMLVTGVVSLDMRYKVPYPKLFVAIGDASYTLYLSHILVISALGKLWQGVGLNQSVSNLIFILIGLLGCIGYALFAYKYIEQPLLSWTRKVTRKRFTFI